MLTTNRPMNKRAAALRKQAGFSLLEVIIAMLVMTVLLMGMLTVFTYAVQYNRGNNLRSQALTILQREAELYRSYKFTPVVTNPQLDAGPKTVSPAPTSADGTVFNVAVTVDNDPNVDGIQVYETMPSGKPCTLKEIKIVVTPQKAAGAPWQSAIVAELTIQRVRSN